MKKICAFVLCLGFIAAAEGPAKAGRYEGQASPAEAGPYGQDAESPAEAGRHEAEADYKISAKDVVNLTVTDDAELTGKFTVRDDGMVMLPLLGSVTAAGLTARELEKTLTQGLDRYILNPKVSVTLNRSVGQRIFVFGNVSNPGTLPFNDGQTLIEVLARVGYNNASEALVLRPKHGATGPTMPGLSGDAEVFRINLREFERDVERGQLSRNVILRDGDTIFVPRVDGTRAFVSGQVRTPGAYSITEGTTVLQVLSLAGGPTENAAINRLRIMRIEKGKQKTLNVRITDLVQPGDTVIVPERFF